MSLKPVAMYKEQASCLGIVLPKVWPSETSLPQCGKNIQGLCHIGQLPQHRTERLYRVRQSEALRPAARELAKDPAFHTLEEAGAASEDRGSIELLELRKSHKILRVSKKVIIGKDLLSRW